MKDGTKVNGQLISVSGRTLDVLEQATLKEFKVAVDDLSKISVYHKPRSKGRFLKGLLFGVASGLALMAADNDEVSEGYKAFRYIFCGLSGTMLGGAGALMGNLTKKWYHYKIKNMPASEIDALLELLGRSCRENVVWEESYKDSILGRLRISWRPYLKKRFDRTQKGEFNLVDNSWPGTVESKQISRLSCDDGMHVSRLRIDYAMNNRLSLGFEYVATGKNDVYSNGSMHLIQDQEDYYTSNSFGADLTANAFMAGVNYEIPVHDQIGLRVETGIGLAVSRVKLRRYYPVDSWMELEVDSYRIVRPVFQLGMSLDIAPHDPLSYGIFISYLYSRTAFKGIQSTFDAKFYPEPGSIGSQTAAFTKTVVVDVPGTNFGLGGFTIGFVVRIR